MKRLSGGIEGKIYGIYAAYRPKEALSVDLYGLRDTGGMRDEAFKIFRHARR